LIIVDTSTSVNTCQERTVPADWSTMGSPVRAASAVKTRIDDLAVLGGRPAFEGEPLHVGRPNQGDRTRLLARMNELLDRNWLTNDGPFVHELEQRLARHLGVGHVVATCNATVALEIAVRALGLRGEVVVPAFTFVATAHALQWQEITPVFADVHPDTHNIDPDTVEALITPRTTGILAVHLWGRPAPVDRLAELARRHGLRLLYDAAHAFGVSSGGTRIGGFGDAEVFSFHATKVLNSFEGGAVATNDGALADRMRLMRNFGFSGLDNVVHVGTNGKMTEVCAAMGLTSLEAFDHFVAVNEANHRDYRSALDAVEGLRVLDQEAGPSERRNFHYVVAEVDAAVAGLTRDELCTVLAAEGVLARRYFTPGVHRMEPYRSLPCGRAARVPHTEALSERVLVLPNGVAIGRHQIDAIASIVEVARRDPRRVRSALAAVAASS
jgi:dTDP-4-amino-4,6-dideoxygalactose transaminase